MINESNITDLIYILIIEDNRYTRQGWELTLNAVSNFKVIGSYGSCEEAFADTKTDMADIVLMDIGLPGMSGIEGVRFLKERHPDQIIVMCTMFEDDNNVFEAICAGAVGYMLKKTSPEDLVTALNEAYTGGSPMTPSIARRVVASFQKPVLKEESPEARLNAKEKEVLGHMAQGKSTVAIANELYLSVDGINYHIRHIYEKLQVHTRAEAVAKGLKKKIIKP